MAYLETQINQQTIFQVFLGATAVSLDFPSLKEFHQQKANSKVLAVASNPMYVLVYHTSLCCCERNEAAICVAGSAEAKPHLTAFCTIRTACNRHRIFFARRRPFSPRIHFCSFSADARLRCTASSRVLLA